MPELQLQSGSPPLHAPVPESVRAAAERKFYKHEFLMERYKRSTRQEAVRAGGQRGREDECEWDGGLSRNTGLVGTQ